MKQDKIHNGIKCFINQKSKKKVFHRGVKWNGRNINLTMK